MKRDKLRSSALTLLLLMTACGQWNTAELTFHPTELATLQYSPLLTGKAYQAHLSQQNQSLLLDGEHFPVLAYKLPPLGQAFYFDLRAYIHYQKPLQRKAGLVDAMLILLDRDFQVLQISTPAHRLFMDWRRAYYGEQIRVDGANKAARYLVLMAKPKTIGDTIEIRLPRTDRALEKTSSAVFQKSGALSLQLLTH